MSGNHTNNSKNNSEFDRRMEMDAELDLDFDDLSDISLDELDDLDNLDLGDLELDDIDFDDLDITSLEVKDIPKSSSAQQDDFSLDDLIEQTAPAEDISGIQEDDESNESMDDLFALLEGNDKTTDIFAEADPVKDLDEASQLMEQMEAISPEPLKNSDLDPSSVDSMELDDLFSALGIEDYEHTEDTYVKNEDSLDSLFENASMDMGVDGLDGFDDIPDIGAEEAQPKEKKKKTFTEILFGEPDEEDEIEARELAAKKEEKKKKREENKVKQEEKKAAKKAMLEVKKKQDDKVKAEKLQKKKEEYEAELEEEKEQKQLPTFVVILVFMVFIAVGCLVYIGSQFFHYSEVIRKAADYFDRDRYRLAYDEVVGVDVKEDDEELRDRIYTVMYVERLYESYENNIGMERYDKALDALLRGLIKYEEHYEEAVALGVEEDVNACCEKIENALFMTFGLTRSNADDINALDGPEYIEAILKCCEKFEVGE